MVLQSAAVNIAKKQITVTLRVKLVTLPLERSLEFVLDLKQLEIVDNVFLISSCEKGMANNQDNGFIANLLSKFNALFIPLLPPKVPHNLFFKIDFKPEA